MPVGDNARIIKTKYPRRAPGLALPHSHVRPAGASLFPASFRETSGSLINIRGLPVQLIKGRNRSTHVPSSGSVAAHVGDSEIGGGSRDPDEERRSAFGALAPKHCIAPALARAPARCQGLTRPFTHEPWWPFSLPPPPGRYAASSRKCLSRSTALSTLPTEVSGSSLTIMTRSGIANFEMTPLST